MALWGEQLAHLLEARGLSNSAFARSLAEITGRQPKDERRNIQRWLKSTGGPNSLNRALIAQALNLPPDHPLVSEDREAAIVGLFAELGARLDVLEKRVGRLEGEDAPPTRKGANGSS